MLEKDRFDCANAYLSNSSILSVANNGKPVVQNDSITQKSVSRMEIIIISKRLTAVAQDLIKLSEDILSLAD